MKNLNRIKLAISPNRILAGIKKVTLLMLLSSAYCAVWSQPVDNPVAAYYSGDEGYPAWTDAIRWNNTLNMAAYTNGANDFEKFENARDQLHNQGGGVLYYPAGTYDFSDMPATGPNGRGLMLKPGIVIRGEAPADGDATDGNLALPTKFVFPFQTKKGGQVPKDWNIVGMMPASGQELKDVDNVGVVWIDFEGAAVYFGAQMTWGSTYANGGAWKSAKVKNTWKNRKPNGTHPMDPFCGSPMNTGQYIGSGKGRLVFGCVFRNASVLNDVIDEGYGADGFFAYKFGARVAIYASHVLVANNVMPKPDRSFKYTQRTNSGQEKTILYDYGMTNAIDINKTFCNVNGNKHNKTTGGYWKPGIVVKDNWFYNHGRKGTDISGTWMIVQNNHNQRDYLEEGNDVYGLGGGWELTLDGYKESAAGGSGSASDNESRGYDLAGQNLWVDGNYLTNTGSDPGNDGEGILAQRHGGTDINSWAYTHNNHVRGSGEPGYLGGYDVHCYGFLIAFNTTNGEVGHIKAAGNNAVDVAFVKNTASKTRTDFGGTKDLITSCPSGTPSAPKNVKADPQSDHIRLTWGDNSNHEIGYKIQRKIGKNGTWETVSYRPRKSNGTPGNPQQWNDYLAPSGKELYYRAVAINCSDNNNGASSEVGPVTIGGTAVNNPPTVAITLPANNATFSAGNTITLLASASDADGTISKVTFYRGGTRLGEDVTNPYQYTWNNPGEGSFVITAKATDDQGEETTSAAITITVNPPGNTGGDTARDELLPNTSWMNGYNNRVDNFVNVKNWDYAKTNHGDRDNGKRFWPQYLAQLSKGAANIGELQSKGWGVYNQNEGSVFKPFSAPGLLYYYYEYANNTHKNRVEGHWNGTVYNTVSGQSGGGRAFSSREDGKMDPIYVCTEFNSENFNWMNRIFGYMMSHQVQDNTLIEGTPAQQWFDEYLKNLTRSTFSTGRVEWNSQNYTGFCIQAIEPVYNYADWDPEAQKRAAAILDWMAVETALHLVDGTYVGPKSRGKGEGYRAQHGSVAPYYYLWFGQGNASAFSGSEGQWTVGYAAHMKYRPLNIALDIANRNFNTPVEIQSAKPYYDADEENYQDWQGNTDRSKRFEFETLWIDDNYTMASIATNRPRGERTFSEQEIWSIGVKQSGGLGLQVFGNANNNNDFGDNNSDIRRDVVGRSPHQEIGQFRNAMLQLIKGGRDQYVYAPKSKSPSFDGDRMFVDMGSGVYVAVTPHNSSGRSSQTKKGGDGKDYTRFSWRFGSSLGALAIEVGTSAEHGSFGNFKNAVKSKTTLRGLGNDQVEYTSTQGNTLKLEWVDPVAYSYIHTSPGSPNCNTYTVNPAGVVPKVWGNGEFIDFNSWDSYKVSYGDPIVSQRWGDARLRLQAGGEGVQIKVDKTTARVSYSTFTPGQGGGDNIPPVVSITAPAPGATFTKGETITIAASASDSDGSIAKVEFFRGSTKLGEDTTSPYRYNWNNVPQGNFSLSAIATDNEGAATTSSLVNISIQGDGGGGDYFLETGGVLSIEAENYDGSVPGSGSASSSYLEVFPSASASNGAAIRAMPNAGVNTQDNTIGPGYSYPVYFSTIGTYNVWIRMLAEVNTNDSWHVGLDGTLLTGGGTGLGMLANNWDWANRVSGATVTVTIDTPGVHTINVWMREDGAQLDKLVFTLGSAPTGTGPAESPRGGIPGGNNAPEVAITSPANGATFTEGETVTISASASDSDGTISKVEFYQGSTKLGEDTTTPYSYSWGNVAAGTYTITAVATDNLGASTISGAITFMVEPGGGIPIVGIYQAESFTASFNAEESTRHSGYTGSGYMDYGGQGSYVEWNSVKEGPGTVTLTFRYANGGSKNDRQCAILVNGTDTGSLPFAPSGGWASWATVSKTVTLQPGANTIRVEANTSKGGPNLDKMEVLPAGGGLPAVPEASAMSKTLEVYPNPTKGTLHIDVKNVRVSKMVLRDMSGLIRVDLEVDDNSTLDLSAYPKGIYILHIITSEGLLTRQIIKE